jgi:DNA-binding MurR/RpiR family transcriptional regulator
MKSLAQPASFVKRVQGVLHNLPEAERRVGEFTLDFPGDLASYTAFELAELAGVSNATVSRFVRRLGYRDFNAARRSVRAEQGKGSPLLLEAKGRAGANTAAAHLRHGHANLDSTFGRISETLIDDIVCALVGARTLWIAGYRSSQAFAFYFRWQVFQFLPRSYLLPGPGETVGEYIASIEKNDCLVAFGLRRRVPMLHELVTHAGHVGAKVLYVGDHLVADVPHVDWLLRCDTRAPGALDNHVAVVALCDLLVTRVFCALGKRGRERLLAVEAAHEAVGEL